MNISHLRTQLHVLLSISVFFFLCTCSDTIQTDTLLCTKDTDCSGDAICLTGGRCGIFQRDCEQATQCMDEQICVSGRCETAYCETDCDCSIDSICESGRCLTTRTQCYTDDHCHDPFICLVHEEGTCLNKRCSDPQCETNEECSGATICIYGRCMQSDCYYSLDCNPDFTCEQATCLPFTCTKSADCETDGKLCYLNRCRSFLCETHTDCPNWTFCKDGQCAQQTCQVSCPVDTRCRESQCVPMECGEPDDCLPFEVCENGLCRSRFSPEVFEKSERNPTRKNRTRPVLENKRVPAK